MSILVTRPSPAGEQLVSRLRALGQVAWSFPLIEFSPGRELSALADQMNTLQDGDLLFALSQHAVEFAHAQLQQQDMAWPTAPGYFAIGRTTALALHTVSGADVRYPLDREITEVLLQLPELQTVAGKRALILRGNGGRELLGETLRERGANVTFVECYQRCAKHYDGAEEAMRWHARGINTLVVTSGEMLQQLWALIPLWYRENWLLRCRLLVVSERLANQARELGWQDIRIADNADNDAARITITLKWEAIMTEHDKSSAVIEETRETVETTPQPETTEKTAEKKNGSNKTSLTLSAIAIAIALAAGAGLYGLVKQQSANQTSTSDALVNQLTALQKEQETQKTELEAVIKQQAAALAEANSKQEELTKQLGEVQQKVATISGTDAKTWLLSQADFLVKLAGRKLWSDQDVTTAAALLKSADASLADMNDPSLIAARRAITEDIASLSAVSQVDYDGIILKVNQLSNQIDNLQLADNNDDDSPMDSDGTELSSSLSEWRINLQKSWQNFMDSFITIRRRDETAVPLLAPNQDIYLRENIRSRLLVAAQAVPRHQEETYKQALDNVSTWVRAYYNTDDATTTAFLEDIDKLSQQNITMNVPDKLTSQPILEKLMQTRVRNLLAQPGVPAEQTGGAAPAPAPAPESAPQGE